MEINLAHKENTTHKVGDIVQGDSGTFYLIVQDGDNSKYRLLNLSTGKIHYHSEKTIEELLGNFNLKKTHIKKETLKLSNKYS
ncbi:hypothetical protein V7166_21800 [Bacillus thuringiensis]